MATVEKLERDLREGAARYAGGQGTVRDLWVALFADLHGLCRDGPLEGPQVDLFHALERWESAVGDDRIAVERELRSIAASLAAFDRLSGPGVP